jgi:16S rRNA (uracil1498-N3)-methyltransferase
MAHVYRFFVPGGMAAGAVIELSDEERHHALRVARVKVGEAVSLFDGSGREFFGAITHAERRSVRVEIARVSDPEVPPTRLTILAAALHAEKSVTALIRRCTELGVSTFRFFEGERSERPPKPSGKWERAAIESCKQCSRLHLPTFEIHSGLEEALAASDTPVLAATLARGAIPIRDALGAGRAASILIGPEGGLTAGEVELALRKGATPISLGPSVLRAEVAATVAASLVQYEFGALGPVAPRTPD